MSSNASRDTIGTRDLVRQQALVLEQQQLIRELQVLQEHKLQLDREIVQVVAHAREGQILISIPGIGPIQAAAIIAAVGNIRNFHKASELKAYFGWAPKRVQSGVSLDRDALSETGVRTIKQMFFLIACNAIQQRESAWRQLYERLLPRLCPYDERKRTYRAKTRVLVRIAGQMTTMVYAFLAHDAEVLAHVPPGHEPPPPVCYDPEIHWRHLHGEYRPLKTNPAARPLLHLPNQPTTI